MSSRSGVVAMALVDVSERTPEWVNGQHVRIMLSSMTLRQLRAFAREHHVSLGYASRKADVVAEIMQYRGKLWRDGEVPR